MSNELATCPILELPMISTECLEVYYTQLALSGRKYRSATLALIPNPAAFFRAINKEGHEDIKERECEALVQFCEVIEGAIIRRGIEGVPKGVYWQGEKVAEELQYSDPLLLALAKRHIKEYGDRMQIDATVKAGVLLVATPLDPATWEETYSGKSTTNATRQPGSGDQQHQTPGPGGQDPDPRSQGQPA